MRLRLQELQEIDFETQEIRAKEPKKDWKKADGVLHYQSLPFIPKVIQIELISQHHNNLLASHFGFNKTRELITQNYYWPSLWKDVEVYVKGYDVCLAYKAVRYKLYNNF